MGSLSPSKWWVSHLPDLLVFAVMKHIWYKLSQFGFPGKQTLADSLEMNFLLLASFGWLIPTAAVRGLLTMNLSCSMTVSFLFIPGATRDGKIQDGNLSQQSRHYWESKCLRWTRLFQCTCMWHLLLFTPGKGVGAQSLLYLELKSKKNKKTCILFPPQNRSVYCGNCKLTWIIALRTPRVSWEMKGKKRWTLNGPCVCWVR